MAQDVLHATYLTVLEGKAAFDGRSTFRTWLFGVIRITAASHRRREWLRRLRLERGSYRVATPAMVPADQAAEADSRATLLRAALDRLPRRQREVIALVFYHDLTVEDAASIMSISVGSARTHYARAKDRLARLLTAGRDV